ncbi:hypothetical protein IO46_09870 [Gallibacterium anatis]|uniref:hypothetical protein n=1 Tax=Gallibacterium anatis TaxID=750 RepID=UPI000530FC2A|nr:hypothetical protein [Gallibacterium anatis]KGQ50096.1 hypothetical protein IO46_09870 [Gallibacterium anatis]
MNQNINPVNNCQAVYPLLTLSQLQRQAQQVEQLVYANAGREAGELSGEGAKPRQQAETDLSLNLIRTIGEAFYQKNLAQPNASENPSAQHKNADMPVYRNVPFSLVLRLSHHLGLPLDGEISCYRQMAFFAPVLDALAEKSEILLGELLTLLMLIKLAQHYQDFYPDHNENFSAYIKATVSLWINELVKELVPQGSE